MSQDSGPALISRRALLAGAAACVLGGQGSVLSGLRSRATAASRQTRTRDERADAQPDAIFEVRTKAPLVALTFDDGPDPAYTPAVLDLLARYDAHATFFLVGANAGANPELVARQLDAGHEVANHTFDHRELEQLSPAEVAAEIDRGEHAIVEAGAPRPSLFRPPRGFTDKAVAVHADAQRYRTIFWGPCVERFLHRDPVAVAVDRLLAGVTPGTIILAHDGGRIAAPGRPVIDRGPTMEAIPLLLEGIRAMALRPVAVGTLVKAATGRGDRAGRR